MCNDKLVIREEENKGLVSCSRLEAVTFDAAALDLKRANTRMLLGGEVIEQLVYLEIISVPGAGALEVSELFSFWRPSRPSSTGRSSAGVAAACVPKLSTRGTGPGCSKILKLTPKQHDAIYSLAGCSDVVFTLRKVHWKVRDALEHVYGIDKSSLATWFKNRGTIKRCGHSDGDVCSESDPNKPLKIVKRLPKKQCLPCHREDKGLVGNCKTNQEQERQMLPVIQVKSGIELTTSSQVDSYGNFKWTSNLPPGYPGQLAEGKLCSAGSMSSSIQSFHCSRAYEISGHYLPQLVHASQSTNSVQPVPPFMQACPSMSSIIHYPPICTDVGACQISVSVNSTPGYEAHDVRPVNLDFVQRLDSFRCAFDRMSADCSAYMMPACSEMPLTGQRSSTLLLPNQHMHEDCSSISTALGLKTFNEYDAGSAEHHLDQIYEKPHEGDQSGFIKSLRLSVCNCFSITQGDDCVCDLINLLLE